MVNFVCVASTIQKVLGIIACQYSELPNQICPESWTLKASFFCSLFVSHASSFFYATSLSMADDVLLLLISVLPWLSMPFPGKEIAHGVAFFF